MKNTLFKIVAVVMCLAMLFSFAGCSDTEVEIPDIESQLASGQLSDGEGVENDKYKLYWNSEENCVVLLDKATGVTWSNVPSDFMKMTEEEKGQIYSSMELKRLNNNFQAPLMVFFCDEEGGEATENGYLGCISDDTYAVYKNGNVITAEYYFGGINAIVPVDYILNDEGVSISIDADKIIEGQCQIYNITVAPFFCSVKTGTEDSYLFYPSGSGAVVDTTNSLVTESTATYDIYGEEGARSKMQEISNEKNIYLPVYGAKNGNEAVCGIVSSGAEQTSLKLLVNERMTGYSYIAPIFRLRDYNTSNIKTNNISKSVNIYSEEMVTGTVFTVDYYPLSGEDADYVGMAKVYQEKLFGDNEPTAELEEDVYAIEFLGGTMEQKNFLGFPYKSLFAATTFGEAKTILEELSVSGVTPNVRLKGFGETGLDVGEVAGGMSFGSAFGSKKDLSALTDYCTENGIDSYIDFDIVNFGKSGSGVNFSFDSAKASNGMAAYQYIMSKTVGAADTDDYDAYKLLGRAQVVETAEKLLGKISGYNIAGVSFSSLGDTSYSDFSNNDYYVKKNMGADVQSIFASFKDSGKKVAASGTNAYAAAVADCIFETPLNSNKLDFYAYDVPFYQMVMKGKVEHTSEAVNAGESLQKKQLQCLETGTSMLYTLYNTYDVTLTYSPYTGIYGAKYSDNKENILASAENYKEYYDSISGQTITDYEVITDDVRHTTFSNGVEIFINYSDEAYTVADGTVVPAMGYVTKG